MRDFEHSLPMLLLRAREATMAHFRPILSEHGLTEQQWRVIRVLREHREIEARDLADRTLMLRPSLSGVLNRLERDGLVERRRGRTDGRKVCLRLTRKAQRLYDRIAPRIETEYSDMRLRFTGGKWDELYANLENLIHLNGREQ